MEASVGPATGPAATDEKRTAISNIDLEEEEGSESRHIAWAREGRSITCREVSLGLLASGLRFPSAAAPHRRTTLLLMLLLVVQYRDDCEFECIYNDCH